MSSGIPPSALAAFSAAVLLLVLDHRRANLGGRATLAFVVAATFYGLVRSLAIRALAETHLSGMPYRLEAPLLSIAGVPLQELIGWTAAAGLAGFFADRLLRRLGRPADAFRTALVAGLILASICLAVETAAVTGGWWSWSLAHTPTDLLRFPRIALLDWGFVAIDFLLPFELWRRRAPLGQRLAGLLLFPLHLAGHALAAPLPGPLPFSGFDLVHIGLIAAVAGAAVNARETNPWPPLRSESLHLRPAQAVAVLLGTAATQLLLAGEPGLLWTTLPLAAVASFITVSRWEPCVQVPPARFRPPVRALGVFAGVLLLGLNLRLPAARRAQSFETLLRQGAEQLLAGRAGAAEDLLERALQLRPEQSEALWLLGWAEMQQGERAEARRHLEAALARRPESKEAARLLALLNREEGKGEGESPGAAGAPR
ncbi:MAG TPA: hypothetical protein DD490_29085 [Acidobacteria bacterium]|nr:hypothetical protein [Acidobacteriota bacterium]